LIISGHWQADVVSVHSNKSPGLLYDYQGFPPHTYEITYPAPGDTALSARVSQLLNAGGIETAIESERGWDHGVFVPLKVAFPEAQIPVVQLSLHASMDPAMHIAIGEALQSLRDEGVLIVGSGNSFHNMRAYAQAMRNGAKGPVAGQDFDNWLSEAVCNPNPLQRNQMLLQWADAPGARNSHPQEEHLLPLHVAAGAAGSDSGKKTLEDFVMGAVISAFQFG